MVGGKRGMQGAVVGRREGFKVSGNSSAGWGNTAEESEVGAAWRAAGSAMQHTGRLSTTLNHGRYRLPAITPASPLPSSGHPSSTPTEGRDALGMGSSIQHPRESVEWRGMAMAQRYEFFAPIWRVMRDSNLSVEEVKEQVEHVALVTKQASSVSDLRHHTFLAPAINVSAAAAAVAAVEGRSQAGAAGCLNHL